MNKKILIEYIKYLNKLFPFKKIQIFENELVLLINKETLFDVMLFLKNHNICQFKVFTCISGVDYLEKHKRFEVVYELLSIRYNIRLRVKVLINHLEYIQSIEKIFPAANWFECEVFDMFGIFFFNQTNLKKILTDYGFEGYPLRKDFPLSGYTEVRYSDSQKKIVNEYLELAQEYRTFDFLNPWSNK